MPISDEERASAKKAYTEMHRRDSSRAFSILLGGLLLIPATLSVLTHQRPLHVWDALVSAFHIGGVLWIILLIQMIDYWRFQVRYASNLKVVSELERKYAEDFSFGLEQEILNTGISQKPAVLWRLDAFLSRKKVAR